MMKNLAGLWLILIFCLCSCNNYEEIKNQDLKGAFILNSSPTFRGYYYQGSDSSYHYFKCSWDLQRDKNFKIAIKNLKVNHPVEFSMGKDGLKIDLLKNDNEKFAENEFYKLYIVRDK
jgi:hypothetical protein